MARFLRLLLVQLRASVLLSAQYRLDFIVDGAMALFWTASSLVPLLVLFHRRDELAGWSLPEALLVVSFFTMLKGIVEGGIQPALQNVVEHIRKGTLDFLLLKPADAQFLVSTSKFEIFRGVDVLAGLALMVWALVELGHVPSPIEAIVTAALLGGAVTILYSIWIAVVSLAFHVVKVDNLTYLFGSIFDAARWPASVFRGALSFLFTFVIPLVVMTSFPALAIQGKLAPSHALAALAGALAFSLVARRIWLRSLRSYTGAGG